MKVGTQLLAKFLALASTLALCVATLSAPLCAAGPCASNPQPTSSREECHSAITSDATAQIISAACKNCRAADLPAALLSFAKENHLLTGVKQSVSPASSAIAPNFWTAAILRADSSQRFKPIDANSLPTAVPQVIALRI